MRKRYILLKDTADLKKGAIVEEECDNGNQGYVCFNLEKYRQCEKQTKVCFARCTVMEQPEWFQELTL